MLICVCECAGAATEHLADWHILCDLVVADQDFEDFEVIEDVDEERAAEEEGDGSGRHPSGVHEELQDILHDQSLQVGHSSR